jgi:parallel beta-helix repeat protein
MVMATEKESQITWPETEGIYLDTRTKNVEVLGNTVANCGDAGIKIHDASNIVIEGNTCYNNYRQSMFHQQSFDYPLKNLTIQENIFFSKLPEQVSLFFKSVQENIKSFATLDYNCYTRPVDDYGVIYTYTPNTGSEFRTLEEWKYYTSQDLNSYKAPVSVIDTSVIFHYIAAKTN